MFNRWTQLLLVIALFYWMTALIGFRSVSAFPNCENTNWRSAGVCPGSEPGTFFEVTARQK